VVVDKVLYSVPWAHVGARTDTRVTDTTVQIFVAGKLVKVWPRAARGRCTDETDYPPEKIAFFSRNPVWCRGRARELGPAVSAVVDGLLSVSALHRLRAAQGVLRLADRHGPDQLDAACRRALAAGDPTYRTVRGILAAGPDVGPAAPPSSRPDRPAASVATPAHLHGPDRLLSHLPGEPPPRGGAGPAVQAPSREVAS
jgi:hypothetical protein